MEYTILILLLPLLSFLFLGLAGMKLKPAAAGLVGTAVRLFKILYSYVFTQFCFRGCQLKGTSSESRIRISSGSL